MRVLRLVFDTNVWLDWLVFADPSVFPLRQAVEMRRAAIYLDGACEAELERVLAYDLGRHSIDSAAQARALAACRATAHRIEEPLDEALRAQLPRCRDPDDQKFLEAALAARANYLVTKDQALLELAPRASPFRIVTAADLAAKL